MKSGFFLRGVSILLAAALTGYPGAASALGTEGISRPTFLHGSFAEQTLSPTNISCLSRILRTGALLGALARAGGALSRRGSLRTSELSFFSKSRISSLQNAPFHFSFRFFLAAFAAFFTSGGRWPWLEPFYNRIAKKYGYKAGKGLAPGLVEGICILLGSCAVHWLARLPFGLYWPTFWILLGLLVLWHALHTVNGVFWRMLWWGTGETLPAPRWSQAVTPDTLVITGLRLAGVLGGIFFRQPLGELPVPGMVAAGFWLLVILVPQFIVDIVSNPLRSMVRNGQDHAMDEYEVALRRWLSAAGFTQKPELGPEVMYAYQRLLPAFAALGYHPNFLETQLTVLGEFWVASLKTRDDHPQAIARMTSLLSEVRRDKSHPSGIRNLAARFSTLHLLPVLSDFVMEPGLSLPARQAAADAIFIVLRVETISYLRDHHEKLTHIAREILFWGYLEMSWRMALEPRAGIDHHHLSETCLNMVNHYMNWARHTLSMAQSLKDFQWFKLSALFVETRTNEAALTGPGRSDSSNPIRQTLLPLNGPASDRGRQLLDEVRRRHRGIPFVPMIDIFQIQRALQERPDAIALRGTRFGMFFPAGARWIMEDRWRNSLAWVEPASFFVAERVNTFLPGDAPVRRETVNAAGYLLGRVLVDAYDRVQIAQEHSPLKVEPRHVYLAVDIDALTIYVYDEAPDAPDDDPHPPPLTIDRAAAGPLMVTAQALMDHGKRFGSMVIIEAPNERNPAVRRAA